MNLEPMNDSEKTPQEHIWIVTCDECNSKKLHSWAGRGGLMSHPKEWRRCEECNQSTGYVARKL